MATDDHREDDRQYAEISEIGNRVRYIQREVREISSRLDDHYHLLRDACEVEGAQDSGAHWYGLMDPEYEEDSN